MKIETPVQYKNSQCSTRYGIITKIQDGRAKVQWQAEFNVGSLGSSTKRIKTHSTVSILKLTIWDKRLRLDEGFTLNPDGLEYRTPVNA